MLPDAFRTRMEKLLGGEFPAFLEGYTHPAEAGLRVNTLKIAIADFVNIATAPIEAIPWCPAGFRILEVDRENLRLGRHPYHAAGLYYIQDPSAMAVAEIVNPQPGERVLDLAAAPGGKTTHLAALMEGKGILVANEVHPQRVWTLAENLERWGVRNAVVMNESPQRLENHFGDYFDRVLLDAPCSGEGMFRKNEEALKAWSPELVKSCAARQRELLDTAAGMVRAGGYLAYSTCTFAPEENEQVVEEFLIRNSKQFSLVDIPDRPGFSRGDANWTENGPEDKHYLRRAVRLWHHHGAAEGHFVALFQRDGNQTAKNARYPYPKLPNESRLALTKFIHDSLNEGVKIERVSLQGSYLYEVPEGMPNLEGLRIIHPGWWVGVMKKNRMEPTHALALGLKRTQVRQNIDFGVDEPGLRAYLRGESLPDPGPDGWVLVNIRTENEALSFPIGWGKRSQGVLKNFYPRGLRQN